MTVRGLTRSCLRLVSGCLPALLGLGTPSALALDPRKAPTQYVHDSWQLEQGLPQNSVAAICQTRDGYVWFGTEEGLARFDGVRFTVFGRRSTPGLASDTVYALLEDREGSLWVGGPAGLTRLKDGVSTIFSTKDGLPTATVGSAWEDGEGDLWFGSWGGGLVRYGSGKFTTYTTKDGLSGDRVSAIHGGAPGELWVGTLGKGLNRLKDGRFTTFTKREGLSSDKVFTNALLRDRGGSLWIGTLGGGLNRLEGGKLTSWGRRDGLSDDVVTAVCEDREGSLWIGTREGGLTRFRDGRFAAFTTKDGLTSDKVTSIYEDREGSLWIGTFGGGVNRLRDGKFTPFTTREGLHPESVWSVYEDRAGDVWVPSRGGVSRLGDGRVDAFTTSLVRGEEFEAYWEDPEGGFWIATAAGLVRFRDGRFEPFTAIPGLTKDVVNSILRDREGSLWIGTEAARLIRLESGRVAEFKTEDGLPDGAVQGILEDRASGLWVATERGLARLENGRFTVFTTREGLPSDDVYSVFQDRGGRLWIETSAGLCRLERGKLFVVLEERLTSPLLEARDGSLWAGTESGLCRIQGEAVTRLTVEDGLFYGGGIFKVLEDEQGDLWMSCNKGVFRVSIRDIDAYARRQVPKLTCVSYGTADGMRSAECNGAGPHAGCKTRDGRLWFPTIRGAVMIEPTQVRTNRLPPPVVLETVVVDGTPHDPARSRERLVLPPGTEKVDFHYTANSFVVPERVRFKYRLEGFDADWNDAGTERAVRYTNLAPRDYTFRVVACNDDGVWNETGAALAFSVEPRFHQTSWFYLACALGVVAAGTGVHRARVKRLVARQRELVRLVDEKTSDLRGANEQLLDLNQRLGGANQKLVEAQEKISRLLASSPRVEGLPDWSRALAEEIAAAIGARRIGIWEVDRDTVTPVSDSGISPPSRETLEGLLTVAGEGLVDTGEGAVFRVTGPSGQLCGVLVIQGRDVAWGEIERQLVTGFAHQLGGALEMARVRKRLAVAEERRAATRDEMHERGIATLEVCGTCGRCYDHTTSCCPEDGSPLESPRPIPYRLLGRYRFVRVLGQGGMGVVFSAQDEKLGRDVAVKLIRPEHWSNPALKERFEREVHAVARIQHPGVVEVHDSGELDDGTAFLVMEKLTGSDLRHLIRTHGRGRPGQVARLVRQGCAALGAAHRAGLVHRDIKPENLFAVDDPAGFRVKVLDFGLAKSMTVEKGLTQTGMVVGTPAYMAPEQVQGKAVDTRADVYSFAAVAYEALTGRQAVPGSDLGRVFIHVLNTVPPPVSTIVPGMSPEIDAAFESALAKDVARRPREIERWGASFVDLLERAEGDPATRGWPESPGPSGPRASSATDEDLTEEAPRTFEG